MKREQITNSTMLDGLLDVDPSFGPLWDELVADWKDDGGPPLYLTLSELARHLVGRASRRDTAGFERVFDLVERWHVNGDARAREAATIGLLEGIQNLLGYNSAQRSVFAKEIEFWLRPETRRCWDKLNRFWDGDIHALRSDD